MPIYVVYSDNQSICIRHRDARLDRKPAVVGKTFLAFPAHAQSPILRIWQEAHCVFVLYVHPWMGGFGFWSVRGVSLSRIGYTVSLLTYWLSPQDVICESLNPAIPTITSYPKLFPPVLFCLIGRLRGPFRSKSEHCFSIFLICKPFSSPACGYQSGVIHSLNL